MTPREILLAGAKDLGIGISEQQADILFRFLAELGKWNRKINLTAITAEQDMVVKHLLDSVSYMNSFDPAPGVRLLDLGSGAGFPAIPIKIVRPAVCVSLVESVMKKASFLRHVVRTLGLEGAEVLDVRSEELPASFEGGYNVVTARAFADLPAAVASGARFLKPEGLLVLSRGPEETIAEQEIRKTGLVLQQRTAITLPYSDNKRALWVFRRPTGESVAER